MTEDGVLRQTFRLAALDVDCNRRLRMSSLLRHMQELSFAQTTAMGFDTQKTFEEGLLWVVARTQVEVVSRLPEYNEEITLETWPGDMVHIVFPRHYAIKDREGNVLLRAVSYWMLFDAARRTMAFPAQHGIEVQGISVGGELEMPGTLKQLTEGTARIMTTTYADIDMNGHVNNTHYADWLDNLCSRAWHEQHIWKTLQINYLKEVPGDCQVTLVEHWDGDTVLIEGNLPSGETAFRMRALAMPVSAHNS